jgi:hypothetical protein
MIINNKSKNSKKVNKAIKITNQTKKNKNSIKKIIRIKIVNKSIKRNRIQINKINKRRNKK